MSIHRQRQRQQVINQEAMEQPKVVAQHREILNPQQLNRNSLKKFKVKAVPEKSALLKAFKGRPVNITAEVRAKKIKNKRSRLFVKAKNCDAILKAQNDLLKQNNDRAAGFLEGYEGNMKRDTIRDLTFFMSTDNASDNKNFFDMYQGEDRSYALDIMTQKLTDMDVSRISFENDAEIAKNAAFLEKLSGMIAAYDRITSENPEYLQSFDNAQDGEAINQRIEMLRSIAAYYVAKKDLITDEHYRTHYDDELSMEVNTNSPKEDKKVAAKLMNAHYAGISLMRSNGTSQGNINKRGKLDLKVGFAKEMADKASAIATDGKQGLDARKKLLLEHYKKSDDSIIKVTDKLTSQKRALIAKARQELGQKEYLFGDLSEDEDTKLSNRNIKTAMEELLSFDMKEFRFSSYREIFENYDHNLALAQRADKCQEFLVRGLFRGAHVDEETMLQVRARLVAFNEIRNTLASIFTFLKSDDGNMAQNDFEMWDQFFKQNSARPDIAAIPCDDMDQYLARCYEKIKGEQPDGSAEMKAEHHKSACLADYKQAEEKKLQLAKDTSESYIRQYVLDHPGEFRADFNPDSLSKVERAYISGKSKKQQIRLVKLLAGHQEDKDRFYKELYDELSDVQLPSANEVVGDNYLKSYGKFKRLEELGKLLEEHYKDVSDAELKKLKKRYPDKRWLNEKLEEYNEAYKAYKDDEDAKALSASLGLEAKVPEGEQEKKKWVRDAEKAFESILSIDVDEFTFTDIEKLFSGDSVRLRHLAELGGSLLPVVDKYKEVLTSEGGRDLCAVTLNECEELITRIDFLKEVEKYYSAPDNILEIIETDKTLSSGKSAKMALDEKRRKLHPDSPLADQDMTSREIIDNIQMKRFKEEYDLGSKFLAESKQEQYQGVLSKIGNSPAASVGVSINKLNSVLFMTRLPAYGSDNGKAMLEGTCNLVSSLYGEIIDNLKNATTNIKRAVNDSRDARPDDFEPLLNIIDETIERCRQDSMIFAEKAKNMYEEMAGKQIKKGQEPRWVEVLMSARSERFDTDKEGTESKKGGAGLSDISIIKNAEGQTIFFRKEDYAPSGNVEVEVDKVVKEVYGEKLSDEEKFLKEVAKKFINNADSKIEAIYNQTAVIRRQIAAIKDKFGKMNVRTREIYSHETIARIFAKLFGDEKLKKYFADCKDSQKQKLGYFIDKTYEVINKTAICYGSKNMSAKIKPGRNLTNRHVATSRLAQILGIGGMVSEARTAEVKVGDNVIKGNLMEESGGKEIFDLNHSYTYSDEAVKQTLTLQVFDFICGQVDRHHANFHVTVDEKTKMITGIRAIDNDMSFGNLKSGDIKKGRNRLRPMDDAVLNGVPADILNKILALNEGALKVMMGDILEADEISDLIERVDYVKKRIRKLAERYPEDTKYSKTIVNNVITNEHISFDNATDERRAANALEHLVYLADKSSSGKLEYMSCFRDDLARKYLEKKNGYQYF